MNRRAFQDWIGRIGLAAALLLSAMPTGVRLLQASADASGHRAHHVVRGADIARFDHDVRHVARSAPAADGRDRQPQAPLPGTGPDCDYCPLLSSMVTALQAAVLLPPAPRASTVSNAADAPRRAWLHPNGLGSRGPPIHG
jgi:hypothetical protein